MVFGRDSAKRRMVQYEFQTYHCRSCGREYGLDGWKLLGRKWGWNVAAYFVYHVVGLRVPQLTMQHSLSRLFGSWLRSDESRLPLCERTRAQILLPPPSTMPYRNPWRHPVLRCSA